MYTKEFQGVIPREIAKVFFQRKERQGYMHTANRNKEVLLKILLEKYDYHDTDTANFIKHNFNLIKDFTEEEKQELNKLTKEELISIVEECKMVSISNNTAQNNRKTLINSLYGALGNIHFRYYDLRNASAITVFGQCAIQWIERKVNEYLNKLLKTENLPYVLYCDTDSVVGDTLIDVNGNKITIEDYYNSIPDSNLVRDTPKDYVKTISNDTSLGMDNQLNVVRKPIKYIMKHKVKKRMFKLTVNGSSVTVTEDHSIIVMRNNNIISVKPKDIIKGDKIVKLK